MCVWETLGQTVRKCHLLIIFWMNGLWDVFFWVIVMMQCFLLINHCWILVSKKFEICIKRSDCQENTDEWWKILNFVVMMTLFRWDLHIQFRERDRETEIWSEEWEGVAHHLCQRRLQVRPGTACQECWMNCHHGR